MTDQNSEMESAGPSQDMVALFAARPEPPEDVPDLINGRFEVSKKLGAGAMGIVYKTYDRKLERTIALKLVGSRAAGNQGQARLLREALALARLNHPNVVAVYDVGAAEDGRTWIAMEYVEGVTLVDWLETRRSWREVVRVASFIARGLAAAHAVKLVHRDLKPGNVMIDGEGRVHVLDFGLAALAGTDRDDKNPEDRRSEVGRAALTVTGAIVGTPAYMAPEQCASHSSDRYADHRADQFALCVMMWEGLYGGRLFDAPTWTELSAKIRSGVLPSPPAGADVPAWLHRVVARGLSVDPDQRFPSISALAGALEQGQDRMRKWHRVRVVALGLACVAAVALGVVGKQRYDRAASIASCVASGTEIAALWTDERKQRLRDSLLATGLPFAATTVERVIPTIERFTEEWSRARSEVCRQAEVDGELPRHLYDRAVACLDDGRQELASLLAVYVAATNLDVINAVRAATRLSRPGICSDRTRLERRPTPVVDAANPGEIVALRRDLFAARGLEAAGRYDAGLELAEATLAGAEALGHMPTVVEARYVVGRIAGWASKFDRAEEVLAAGFVDAGAIGADEVAARSASELSYTVGYEGARGDEGLRWARSAEMFVRRIGEDESLLGAEILANEGSVEQARSNFPRARALAERALAIQERELGPEHMTIAFTLNNVATALDQQGESRQARAVYGRALAIIEKTHGPDHLVVASFLNNLAGVEIALGAYTDAESHGRRAQEIQEAALGPQDPQVAFTLLNRGNNQVALGSPAKGREFMERALEIQQKTFGEEHPVVIHTLHMIGATLRREGKYEESEARQTQALALAERTFGEVHREVSSILTSLGLVRQDQGDYKQARALFMRALAINEDLQAPHDIAIALLNMANIDESEADYDAAQAGYERALALQMKVVEAPHRNIAELIASLAIVEQRRGRHETARQQMLRALAMYEAALGSDNVGVSQPLVNLAAILQAEGRHDEAMQHLERARRLLDSNPDTDHERLPAVQVGLGISGLALGRAQEVIPGLEQALAHRDAVPSTAEDRFNVRFTLAQALWDAPEAAGRDRRRARELAREAMKLSAELRGAQLRGLAELKEWLRTHK